MLFTPARGDRPATIDRRWHISSPSFSLRPSTTSWPRRGGCARGAPERSSPTRPKVFVPLTTLCRDVCGYCTFARPPRRGERAYLTEDEVLAIARAGADAGCSEALFTLGDRPEARYRVAREELEALGCDTTLEYLARCAKRVLDETGLLPHLNPGVMTREELAALRPVAASMGIMLETTAERLAARGGPHWASPDKAPARRLETIRLAGELAIPFTSGILIGIGETREERIDALLALRSLAEEHGHLREVIVQNFRAKPGTRMAEHPDAPMEEHLWSIAVARIVLGPGIHVQAPPNLAYDDFPLLLDAGIDDWGGVSPVTVDHVNPEAPWPEVERLREACRSRGLELAPRLPLYPEHVADLERWVDPAVAPAIRRAADAHGLAREDRWAPGEPVSRAVRRRPRPGAGRGSWARSWERTSSSASSRRADASASGCCAAADALRREVCGDDVTYVVTRNIQYTNVCYFRCGFCAFSKGKLAANLRGPAYLVPEEEIVRRVQRGVGARGDRGVPAGRDPPVVHRRLLRGRRLGDSRGRSRHPRPRLLGARGVAGRGDARARSRDLPRPAARPRPRVAPRHRGRDPRRRGASGHLPGQGDDGAVARGARRRAPGRPLLERDDHVRARRAAGALGAASPPRTRAAGALGRLHRIRAAPLRADGGADLPAGAGAARSDVRRGAAPPCGRAPRAPSVDHERAGELGEARARWRSPGARRRRQRPRRDADERVDLARGGVGVGAGDATGGDGGADPLGRSRPAAADDDVR